MNHLLSKIMLAGIVVTLSVDAIAQPAAIRCGRQPINSGKMHSSFSTPAYSSPKKNLAGKTTAGDASRVIAIADLRYDVTAYIIEDTAVLTYSGSRGSNITSDGPSEIKYDLADVYFNDTATGTFVNLWRSQQTFDANNNILTRTSEEWKTATGSWRNANKDVQTYDAMNNPTSYLFQIWDIVAGAWVNNYKSTSTYAGHNLISEISEGWNIPGGTWENSNKHTNTYDAANNVIGSLDEYWNSTSGSWQNSMRETSTYDGMNNLMTRLQENWAGTTWQSSTRQTFTYDAMNNRLTQLTEDFFTGSWINSSNINFSAFSGNHQPGVEIGQQWDPAASAFVNTYKRTATFNSFDQPTYVDEQSWNNSAGAWGINSGDHAARYYYETYVTETPKIVNAAGKAAIYPVPAASDVFIDVAWSEPQAFSVSIIDMQGRLQSAWNVAKCKQYCEAISVRHMPAGIYTVSIKSDMGNITEQMTVVAK
jgi:hypothetical protein